MTKQEFTDKYRLEEYHISVFTPNGYENLNGMISWRRIKTEDVPDGMRCYDIRHSDDDWSTPATLEQRVVVNWFGTFVSDSEIDFGGDTALPVLRWSEDAETEGDIYGLYMAYFIPRENFTKGTDGGEYCERAFNDISETIAKYHPKAVQLAKAEFGEGWMDEVRGGVLECFNSALEEEGFVSADK